jgi:hypothetical protein
MTAAVNGGAGAPRRPQGQPRQVGTPQEPVALGSKPQARPAPSEHRLVGKELTDAVAGILAAGSSVRDEQGDDSEGDANDQGDEHRGRADDSGVDESADESESGGQSEGGSGGDDEETSIDDLARALQVSTKELNKVVLKVGDQKLTLGELKAKLPMLAKLEQERAEFADQRQTTELEQIDAHRRIMAIIDSFPDRALPPAVLQRVNAQYEQNKRAQAELLTKARPQWGDAKYVESERPALVALGKRYGFSTAELGSIIDHRQILILQDFAHALARIDAAKGAGRRVDPVGDKPLSKETSRAAAIPGRAPGVSNKSMLARRVADLIAKG